VDIHEIAAGLWVSTTTAPLRARSVAAMSTLNVPTTHDHSTRRRPAPVLGLQVLIHRRMLDRHLAEGRNPASDPQLKMRAAQLQRPAARARLARMLRETVCSLDDSALAQYLRPEAPLAVASVRACAREINDLSQALTAPNPDVRGVAIVRVLLTNGAGPLYAGGQPTELRAVVLAASAAL
jgi:hypothetical protein